MRRRSPETEVHPSRGHVIPLDLTPLGENGLPDRWITCPMQDPLTHVYCARRVGHEGSHFGYTRWDFVARVEEQRRADLGRRASERIRRVRRFLDSGDDEDSEPDLLAHTPVAPRRSRGRGR